MKLREIFKRDKKVYLPDKAQLEKHQVVKKRFFNRALNFICKLVIAWFGFTVLLVIVLRWIDPPTSAFMVKKWFSNHFKKEKSESILYHWADWDKISSNLKIAVIAAEDQKFSEHWGFDIESINSAMERNKKGKRIRGASTITQQVVKNLFLWPGKSYFRKGLEAYFTILLELFWSKQRILEVYVNIAEYGENTYGAYAAAERFFGKKPADLSQREAALFAAVLPNPKRFKISNPSQYVQGRVQWIEEQMGQLGGAAYLKDL